MTFPLKLGLTLPTITVVIRNCLFPGHYHLGQRCLEGDEEAIRELQTTYRPIIVSYLHRRGATLTEIDEVTEGLWSDCLVERPGKRPGLATYTGDASLDAWFRPVAFNRLLKLRADLRRRNEVPLDQEFVRVAAPEERKFEAPLVQLMYSALEHAFRGCSAEDFVLIQLAHSDRLFGDELGQIFGCSPSHISRRLEKVRKRIAVSTIRYIREKDPLIEIDWDDFLDLCRFASPACLGAD